MKKIIVTCRPWGKRIAILEDSLLQNIYFDYKENERLEKSFFKGKVKKVLQGVQSAFVDIGKERAGFLHISEIDRDLAFKKMNIFEDESEDFYDEFPVEEIKKKNLDISNILKEGEDLLVQVSKEPINEKGAKLTTCFTLPGRFIILMPNISKVGISKKIVDIEKRKELKDLVISELPENCGCIIRTTCENVDSFEIVQDVRYLLDLWEKIRVSFDKAKVGDCIYKDINLTFQIIRDQLDSSIQEIICDDKDSYNSIKSFISDIAPEYLSRIGLYSSDIPLFKEYNIEKQIQDGLNEKVYLSSGGSIIIETTEAMTVIDVNTARYVGSTKLDDTILKTNMDAAKEIVRQLKLRNIGGIVVIDFIDMSSSNHRNMLFSYFEKTLKKEDKSQSVVLKISEFGLVQMTRKRTGKSLRQCLMEDCSSCKGRGIVKSINEKVHSMFRVLEDTLREKDLTLFTHCIIIADNDLSDYIVEKEYDSILSMEKKFNLRFIINKDELMASGYRFEFLKEA